MAPVVLPVLGEAEGGRVGKGQGQGAAVVDSAFAGRVVTGVLTGRRVDRIPRRGKGRLPRSVLRGRVGGRHGKVAAAIGIRAFRRAGSGGKRVVDAVVLLVVGKGVGQRDRPGAVAVINHLHVTFGRAIGRVEGDVARRAARHRFGDFQPAEHVGNRRAAREFVARIEPLHRIGDGVLERVHERGAVAVVGRHVGGGRSGFGQAIGYRLPRSGSVGRRCIYIGIELFSVIVGPREFV